MHCLTPLVLMALRGEPCPPSNAQPACSPFDERVLTPPRGRSRAGPTRGPNAKTPLGDGLEYAVESANFSVQWNDDDSSEAYASTLIASLEEAWQHLIVEDGWAPPLSSDVHLLTFILDPALGGSGFTTVYVAPDYPDGYPVSFVNPGFGDDEYPGYSRSVAVHELGHMVQFGVRDGSADDGEAWYWEASAEWMADRGVPDINTYALSTWWYATHTELAYDSMESSHAYGMLLLPRAIEDQWGPDVVRDSWSGNDGADWADAIGDAAGVPIGDLIADMAGAYVAGALTESELFYPPQAMSPPEGEQAEGELYGTVYAKVDNDGATFEVIGPASVRFATEGEWSEARPDDPFTAAITRTGEGPIIWGPAGDSAVDIAEGTADSGRRAERCGCAAQPAPRAVGVDALGLTLLGLGWVRLRRGG